VLANLFSLCTFYVHVFRTAFNKELFENSKTKGHYKAKAFKGLPNVRGRDEM